jgi:hypothetical protein
MYFLPIRPRECTHTQEYVYVEESSWFGRSIDQSTSRQSGLWALEEEEEEEEVE